MLQEIKSLLFITVGLGASVGFIYLQMQLLIYRERCIRKRGGDPWRHGWTEDGDKDDEKNKSK